MISPFAIFQNMVFAKPWDVKGGSPRGKVTVTLETKKASRNQGYRTLGNWNGTLAPAHDWGSIACLRIQAQLIGELPVSLRLV